MFQAINSFIGLALVILILKWVLPLEAVELAAQILIKILTLIRDLLAQVNL